MVSITLSVPPEVKEKMNQFPEMNWSGFVRNSIENKVKELSLKDKMLEKLEGDKKFEKIWMNMQNDSRKKGIAELKAGR
jgi:hypothetical protein